MRRDRWNTYATRGYTFDAAQDQRSAGGVHLHQVRLGREGWQTRIKQTNGKHSAHSDVQPVDDATGEARYQTALEGE